MSNHGLLASALIWNAVDRLVQVMFGSNQKIIKLVFAAYSLSMQV